MARTIVVNSAKSILAFGATTMEIRAIDVTDNAPGNAPMLPCVLQQIGKVKTIASLIGDGAYDIGKH